MTQIISFDEYTPTARYDGVPWRRARIDEAATSSGSWTTIDTITLAGVDADPANPVSRSFTTDLASDTPGLWYRVVFLDASSDTSQPTTPVQNVVSAAPVAQFATADDFAARLGLDFSDAEEARANALLMRASGIIQSMFHQTISLVSDDTLTMRGTVDDRIRLPQRPVVSVASVTLGSVTLLEGTNWYLDGNELVREWPGQRWSYGADDGGSWGGGASGLSGWGWGGPFFTLTIVYTHGYEEIPEPVPSITMEMVNRVWQNPGSVARETIGSVATIYDNNRYSPVGLLLNVDERRALRQLFGSRVRSLAVK